MTRDPQKEAMGLMGQLGEPRDDGALELLLPGGFQL